MTSRPVDPLGFLEPSSPPAFARAELTAAIARVRVAVHVVREPRGGRVGLAFGGSLRPGVGPDDRPRWLGTLSPLYPEWLGDRSFQETYGTRFAYVTGAMANGIAAPPLVKAMARAGMLGFFGAAGLTVARIEAAVDELSRDLGALPWGANLIHSPQEPHIEKGTADLYVHRGVRAVEAAAFMGLTPALVKVSLAGVRKGPDGWIVRPRQVMAKISRPEVARHFLSPAPEAMVQALVASGDLTPEEARLAKELPVAEDLTVEADSGGHTDNRPLVGMFPRIAALRDELVAKHGYQRPVRVGAAGGLGTPTAVAAAFAMGAAYVVTGSVNQGCLEAGTSDRVKAMLAQADLADVTMAPAADMFELGVDVQVLRRGTLFAQRAHKLRELWRGCASLAAIPADERAKLEREVFRASLAEIWAETERFFAARNPAEIERAAKDPKHQMALVFRWYLGQASRWAIQGVPDRAMDYQVWCGPAMGAFNAWARGSFLENPANRAAVQVARNLMEGAAVCLRAAQVRSMGAAVPPEAFSWAPRPLDPER